MNDEGWLMRIVGLLLVLIAGTLIFARAMDRDLNHDEHQFLAPAALMSREGAQPWRDYPLFHLPNLVLAYAAVDRFTGNLLLGAKILGVIASTGVIALLVGWSLRRADFPGLLTAAAAALFLLADPLFLYTAGKTWNHEVPAALLVGALVLLALAAKRDALWLTALAGACAGWAAGCRLTFAPTLIGLFVFAFLLPFPGRRRLAHAAVLTVAATLALTPSLYYLASQPEGFVFGNLEFPRLRLVDPTNERIQKTATLWRKVRYFLKEVMLPSWPIFSLWLIVGVRQGWLWFRKKDPANLLPALVLLTFPFLLLGCFAPARYQYQHFYAFIPLVLLGLVASGQEFLPTRRAAIAGGFAGLAVVFGYLSHGEYREPLANLLRPEEWYPARIERLGAKIREHAPSGRILTLGPAIPIAGGLHVYPQLATGAFVWRSAHLVPVERRGRLRLLAPEDLDALLAKVPPAGILTGVEEDEEEAPLIAWAKAHRYRAIDLKKKRTLWVPTE